MSFQIASLKILSSYPGGRASLADLKRDLAILTTSGPDWTQRMKRLAARAPDLDAFSQRFIERDEAGWSITAAGRAFLNDLETTLLETAAIKPVVDTVPEQSPFVLPALKIVRRRERKLQRRKRLFRLSA